VGGGYNEKYFYTKAAVKWGKRRAANVFFFPGGRKKKRILKGKEERKEIHKFFLSFRGGRGERRKESNCAPRWLSLDGGDHEKKGEEKCL